MATVVQSIQPLPLSPRQKPVGDETGFFVTMTVVLAIITFVAFSTTYLLPVATGRFVGPPLLHVHGVIFLAWPLLFIVQALTSKRNVKWHRGLGLAGISLATAMVMTGLAAIGSSISSWRARGVGVEGQSISVIAFTGVVMFAVLFVAAVWKRRDRLAHPRLMTLATLAIMQASSGRLALLIASGGNPAWLRPGLMTPPSLMLAAIPHLALDALIIGALVFHDRKRLGNVHMATLVGGGLIVVVHLGRPLLLLSPVWASIAEGLEALMPPLTMST